MPSYFLPPVQVKRPHWQRILHVDPAFPRSARYRHMATKQFIGIDVTVSGTLYKGGRWHGPLTSTEITDITNAGYGARIATVADIKDLPNNLD